MNQRTTEFCSATDTKEKYTVFAVDVRELSQPSHISIVCPRTAYRDNGEERRVLYKKNSHPKHIPGNIVRGPGGPTVDSPPPPPPRPVTFHYGIKIYLRVSRTQSHLFPGQSFGCTGVTALCARVPSCVHPGAD